MYMNIYYNISLYHVYAIAPSNNPRWRSSTHARATHWALLARFVSLAPAAPVASNGGVCHGFRKPLTARPVVLGAATAHTRAART